MVATESVLAPGIVSRPGVRGGKPVIEGSGVAVWRIVEIWRGGTPLEEIPVQIPHISLRNVFQAMLYYLDHKEEIEDSLRKNYVPPEWRGKRFDPKSGEVVPF